MKKFIRATLIALIASILPSQTIFASASNSTIQVIVKSADNSPYSGALVKADYSSKYEDIYGTTNLETSDASGLVTLTYPSNVSLGAIYIQPPTNDTTHAVGILYPGSSNSGSTLQYKLKRSDFRMNVKISTGNDAPAGWYVSSSNLYFMTLRSGPFGVSGDLLPELNNNPVFEIEPSLTSLDQYGITRYYKRSRTENGWLVQFFTNSARTQQISPVNGVYEFTLRGHNLAITLKDSNGTAISIPSETPIRISAFLVNDEGVGIANDRYGEAAKITDSNGLWRGSLQTPGKYRIFVMSEGNQSIPSFFGPFVWVDSQGGVSSTGASGSYSAPGVALELNLNMPNNFAKFSFGDRNGNNLPLAFYASILKKINGSYDSDPNSVSYLYASNGLGAFSLPQGEYRIDIGASWKQRPRATYDVKIENGVYEIKDDAGNLIAANNQGVFELLSGRTNAIFRVLNGNIPVESYRHWLALPDDGMNYSSDSEGYIYARLPNGSMTLNVSPKGSEIPPKTFGSYRIQVTNGQVQSIVDAASNATVTVDGAGVFNLQLATPRVTGTVKHQGVVDVAQGGKNLQVYRRDGEWWTNLPFSITANAEMKYGFNIQEAGTYRLRPNAGTNTQLYSLGSECSIPATGNTTCDFDAPPANLKIQILDQNEQVLFAEAYVSLDQYVDNATAQLCCGYPSYETSIIEGRLIDGNYQLTINPQSPGRGTGDKRTYRLTIANGSVSRLFDTSTNLDVSPVQGIFKLALRKSNFRGKVMEANSPIANSWIYSTNLSGKGESRYAYTDSEGRFEFFLEDGENELRVNPTGNENPKRSVSIYRATVVNGEVTQLKKSDGTLVSASSGVFPVSLAVPNVTGTFTVGGLPNDGHIQVLSLSQDRRNFYWSNIGSSVNNSGQWAVNLEPGSYVFQAYSNDSGRSFFSGICEVTSAPSNTCETSFPNSNFKFEVLTTSGQKVNTYLELFLSYVTSNGAKAEFWFGKGRDDTNFELSLLPGSYELRVWPGEDIPINNVGETFTFDVSAGEVSNLRKIGANSEITKLGDKFSLSLKPAPISGLVFADDGVTPIPYPRVEVSSEINQKSYPRVRTGANGQFSILAEDGTYKLVAYPNFQDVALIESAPTTATISGGVGPSQLYLLLRRPNVVGTVTGPTGILSKQNLIRVKKFISEKNSFEYVDTAYRVTNGVGNFSIYLEPGTYKFEAFPDALAKGGRTIGSPCIVPVGMTQGTTITCNIVLASANLKLKLIKNQGNAQPVISGAWINAFITNNPMNVSKTYDWFETNVVGEASASLETGSWLLWIDPPSNSADVDRISIRVEVSETNAIISVKDNSGITILPDANGFYSVLLPSVNLTGSVTNNGTQVNFYNHVTVKQLNGDFYQEVTSRGTNTGSFGFRVEPGTYRVEARPYPGLDSNLATTRSAICEVTLNTNTVCNVALQAGNLLGQIRATDNTLFRDFYANVFSTTEKGEFWYQQVNLQNGNFAAYLENGSYRLEVAPYWEFSARYSRQNFNVTVVNGSITGITNNLSGAQLIPVNGRYQFSLSAPQVKGKVLMPGTSTQTVPFVTVLPIDVSKNEELWRYQAYTDASGRFGLNIPDGTYDLIVRVWGSGSTYTSSAKLRVVVRAQTPYLIVNGSEVATEDIDIRLRAPNFVGRVIRPKANPTDPAVPISEVSVNVYMNGQYQYAWTGADGRFGVYFEGSASNCNSCEIYLNSYRNNDLAPKRYTFSSFTDTATTDQGDLQMGRVNSTFTILEPVAGGSPVPSKDVYVAIEELSNNIYLWQPGASTDYLGKAGLSLEEGKTYRITAFPNGDRYSEFAAKSISFTFNPANHTNVQITYDLPNVNFSVKDRAGRRNSWGFVEIKKLNTTSNPQIYEYYRNGTLSEQGTGAALLSEDGTYQIKFWPSSKTVGIPVIAQLSVNGTTVTLSDNASISSSNINSLQLTVTLPAGNVSGVITKNVANIATPIGGAIVTAIRKDDNSIRVQTISQNDGSYEFSLDLSFEWELKVLEPIETITGTLLIPIVNGRGSNDSLGGQNVSLS